MKTLGVSTHSRLKAAGGFIEPISIVFCGFNTQPPEGGWALNGLIYSFRACFNTQPPEGGWGNGRADACDDGQVSTHSRLKAAGGDACQS